MLSSATLRVGAVYPQTELGHDTGAIRTWVQEVERLGYRHILIYDHVVGADPAVHDGWTRAYDVNTTFREPLVLLGYMAAISSLEFVTGVVILPQRQTVLVAKQAAEVDLLARGNFRLGIGIGWNPVEYQALGEDFTNRGRRSEEQISLLRRLWVEQSVTFTGEHDCVVGAGLNPMPVQRPIPIWIGGVSERTYARIGRLADGWFPNMPLGPKVEEALAMIDRSARAAGRDPATLGMEPRINYTGDVDALAELTDRWHRAGASHVAINTMRAGLAGVDEHLTVLAAIAQALGLPGPD